MHSTKLLIQTPPNSQYSHRPESNLPVSPYFFYFPHYLFLFLPLERRGNISRCNLQTLFPAQSTSHTESHGASFTPPSRTSRRAQSPQHFSLARRLQLHRSSSRVVRRNHFGCLIPASGSSQISTAHFSSPPLSPAASSQPGDAPTMTQLTAGQLLTLAWLHPTVPVSTSDLCNGAAELPRGSRSG